VKKPIALLLGVAAFGLAAGGTASAQIYYYGPGYYGQRYYLPGMAPWRIARIVRAAGLTPLSAPARRGPTYEVVALDPEGRHVRVMVDAYQGAITSVRPVAVLRQNEPYAPPPRVATAPSAEEAEGAMGPRAMPGGPVPYGTGAARAPQILPPQSLPPQTLPPQASLPPSSAPPSHSRLANVPALTGATPPAEIERTPIPRPRPRAAATAAVTSTQPTTATPSAAATTAPADVPEAPPAPTRARPTTPAAPPAASAASAAASGKTTTGQSPATASAAPRAATTLVPVAPLE
jgi:hypothetical protein